PALGGDRHPRLWPAASEALVDLDEGVFHEYVEVPAQVPIGQRAELFEFAEEQAIGPGGERDEDAEARLFVQHAVEAIVGEPARGRCRIGRVALGHERASRRRSMRRTLAARSWPRPKGTPTAQPLGS